MKSDDPIKKYQFPRQEPETSPAEAGGGYSVRTLQFFDFYQILSCRAIWRFQNIREISKSRIIFFITGQ
jgi:hypothetical protein